MRYSLFIIMFLSVVFAPVSEAYGKKKEKKKEPFFLTDQAMGNAKELFVTNKNDISVRAKAISKSQGAHSKSEVELEVAIDCDGSGKKFKEKKVPVSHPAFSHIENKKGDKVILCGLYHMDVDPVHVHMIVYEKNLSGECENDGLGQPKSEDIVIPLFGKKSKDDPIEGFCEVNQ